jgi:hypothetical protein
MDRAAIVDVAIGIAGLIVYPLIFLLPFWVAADMLGTWTPSLVALGVVVALALGSAMTSGRR